MSKNTEDPRINEIRAVLAEFDERGENPMSIRDLPSVSELMRAVRAILDRPAPALEPSPRVFFPGDTVPAGTPLMLDDGSLLEADTGDERWDINDGVAVELLGIPSREEWQDAVDQARDARADAEWQHTEGITP